MKTINVPGKTTTIGVRMTPARPAASTASPPTPASLVWVDVTGPEFWSKSENSTWDGTDLVLPIGSSYGHVTASGAWFDTRADYLLVAESSWGTAQISLLSSVSSASFIDTTEGHKIVWQSSNVVRFYHGDWSAAGQNRITRLLVSKLPEFQT